MEFQLMSHESWIPCEVVADEDQTRFWVRNADTTGEFFRTKEELITWIQSYWDRDKFLVPEQYDELLNRLTHSPD
ncbi:hypothetical protein ACFO25_03385 [Paenactinomyces guangxiensis]|uniref:Uncharacterized protein n=1 Tax=Paenactinomyces guangxiensis TaxID=1490290 RepID=A0A7W2A946_9BACL|nr:hypothetical protein [Paenactinomyces guangxiensis]MBA4494807.1 hypothetical protein [Paenactinomyces guangxiensis]MBH8591890.1 hypothetical protein [Paenactinomyces guangxiensis]